MANIKDYTPYQEFAQSEGFGSVAEMVSKVGSKAFKRKFREKTQLKISIELNGCRWLVNGKQLKDCSDWEQDFMNRFFQEIRTEKLLKDDIQN